MSDPRCAACHKPRPPRELLRVTVNRTGATYYVCRPQIGSGMCFRDAVPSASSARIELAEPGS